MKRLGQSLSLILLVALVGAVTGCDRNGGTMPDSAEARMETTTQSLPSDTQVAIVLSDLAKFRKSTEESRKTIDRLVPLERLINQADIEGPAKNYFGDGEVKFFKEKFWTERGVASNGSFALGIVDYNGVILTYVDDKKKFEKKLTKEYDAEPKSLKVAGNEAQSLETDDGNLIWTYEGKLAKVVLPSKDMAEDAGKEPTKSKKTLERVLKTTPKESLAKSSGFKKYKTAADNRPTLFYMRLAPFMKEEELETDSEYGKKFAKNFRESLDGAGLILETEENRINGRLWLGMTEDGKKYFEENFQSPVTGDWTKFTTSETLLAIRAASNWKSMWDSFESTMKKEEQEKIEQGLAMAKGVTGLDVRKDIIDNLNGQSGLFLYGIGGKADMGLLGNPMKAASNIRALYTLKFGDAATLKKLAKKADGLSEEYVQLRPLKLQEGEKKVKSIQVVDLKMPSDGIAGLMSGKMPEPEEDAELESAPIRFFVHEDSLVLASTAIPEAQIHGMLTGEGDAAKSITEVENLDLGAKFAEAEQLSGLYVNFERFRAIFGDMMSQVPSDQARSALSTLEEALLATQPEEKGVFIDLTLDLLPGEGGAAKKEETKEEGESK